VLALVVFELLHCLPLLLQFRAVWDSRLRSSLRNVKLGAQ
jgi:hypothetical protein